eukprot:gnl/TRDRNA2_/TRDRNA2_183185_c0_seq1.p1 gnl/TRDRNA2_/TRDRNA2_183185_c0~~gnl/TRDRNA2_/TRDRNA2_183185_c0_seq1.p1  ORF type:complete len:314 (+),score=68.29 gnl/TRDRNA2_/TRDRNA2_183185_c0_seq1:207-1148(+)
MIASIRLLLLVTAAVAVICDAALLSIKTPMSSAFDMLDELAEIPEDDEFDSVSLISMGTEIRRPPIQVDMQSPPEIPNVPDDGGWEAKFAWGIYHSQVALQMADPGMSSFVADVAGAVPRQMLHAEALLRNAHEGAPTEQRNDKLAELALRVYYHAKWLAERNYARAAEWRYRQAAIMARRCQRTVLASHALSRLGYFLMHWRRLEDARVVLRESERLNSKSNPLAPYLLGVIERKGASDMATLLKAEERILTAGAQPSEELQQELADVVSQIEYWRSAQGSARQCFQTLDAAHLMICLLGHAASTVREVFVS